MNTSLEEKLRKKEIKTGINYRGDVTFMLRINSP